MELQKTERLESLDVLRGFDLFCLVFLQPVILSLGRAMNFRWMDAICSQFEHVQWEGFGFWDIIMPLFNALCICKIPEKRKKKAVAQTHPETRAAVVDIWHDVPGESAGSYPKPDFLFLEHPPGNSRWLPDFGHSDNALYTEMADCCHCRFTAHILGIVIVCKSGRMGWQQFWAR